MLWNLERTIRHFCAVPWLLLGIALSFCAAGLIHVGAWIADIDTEAE